MAASVVLGRDLQILPAHVAVRLLVLDAHVREVDLFIEVRQVMLPRPFLDLFDRAIRPAVAVAIASVAVLQEALVLAFQLAVELHAEDARVTRLQPLRGLQVGALELRVVRSFPRLICARVERLAMV